MLFAAPRHVLAGWGLALLACRGPTPEAPPPAPTGPAAPVQSLPPVVPVATSDSAGSLLEDREAEEAERLLLGALSSQDPQTWRSARDALGALVAKRPAATWIALLHARAARGAASTGSEGDLDAPTEAHADATLLARLAPDERALYHHFFDRPDGSTLAGLHCNLALRCLRRTHQFKHHLPAGEPFQAPPAEGIDLPDRVECEDLIVEPGACPDDFLVLERVAWTERSRERLEAWNGGRPRGPEDVARDLGLRPGLTVVDVGAGTGFFTFPFARAVSPGGRVWAVDISPPFVRLLETLAAATGDPVFPVLSSPTDIGVPPGSADLVWMAVVFQDIRMADLDAAGRLGAAGPPDPAADTTARSAARPLLASIRRALKPDGRLVVLEHKVRPDPTKRLLQYDPAEIRAMAETAGLAWKEDLDLFPSEDVMVFTPAR